MSMSGKDENEDLLGTLAPPGHTIRDAVVVRAALEFSLWDRIKILLGSTVYVTTSVPTFNVIEVAGVSPTRLQMRTLGREELGM